MGSPVWDTGLAVYTGSSCTALSELACDRDSGVNFCSKLVLSGRPAGEKLYVRVWVPRNYASGKFLLSAYDCPSSTPPPVGSSVQTFCSSDSPTISDIQVSGENVKWYTSAKGGTALVSTTSLTDNTVY